MTYWIQRITHHKTARNYVGGIRWATGYARLSNAWDTDDMVKRALKARDKTSGQQTGGRIEKKLALEEWEVKPLIAKMDNADKHEEATFLLLAWELAARVQSEVDPMLVGTREQVDDLPRKGHSAVTVSGITLWVRWAKKSTNHMARQ